MQDAAGQPSAQQKDLAITSFVLGLLSVLCFAVLFGSALINVGPDFPFALFLLCIALPTGLAAILCGHIAHHRARRAPAQCGGSGFAIAGFVMGYVGLVISLALLLPAFMPPKPHDHVSCPNSMKQIGLAFHVWAIDNDGCFPFNVSTNKGGTLEWCRPGADGFDRNAAFHFRVMSNELATPRLLNCPDDAKRRPALNFESLRPENVGYLLRSGTNLNPQSREILVVCPIHHYVLLCDGTVQTGK
ncbi:MAG: DUF4190 domain-containing protein [Verrucomicrobiota bacterium]|jgi:hypothetical protein